MTAVGLREWRDADAALIEPILEDPQVLKWSGIADLGAGAWIAEQQAGHRGPSLAICSAENDDVVFGKMALRRPGHTSLATRCAAIDAADQPAGELSYWVLPAARGRGVASLALSAMLDRCREDADLRSVVLDIEIDNLPSMRTAARVGAERREPTRVEFDRRGVARTLAVHVVRL